MLTDKQSLLLCGLVALLIFVAGVLDILGNFIVLTILSIAFIAIVVNLFFGKHKEAENNQEHVK
jgi:hypothetical protein